MKADLLRDFPLMVEEWLSSHAIALMTPAEEGGFLRLLLHAWSDPDCCLTEDPAVLSQLSRLNGNWENGGGAKILACFKKDEQRPGFIYNPKQRSIRIAQHIRVQNGRKGGRTRAANAKQTPSNPQAKVKQSPSNPQAESGSRLPVTNHTHTQYWTVKRSRLAGAIQAVSFSFAWAT